MPVNIVVPELSESVVDATVLEWLKQVGEQVEKGETVVMLATDKVSLEVAAEESGVLTEITRGEDEDVTPGEVLGMIDADASAPAPATQSAPAAQAQPAPATQSAPAAASSAKASPVAERMAQEQGVNIAQVPASDGKRVTKSDVERFVNGGSAPATPQPSAPAPAQTPKAPAPAASASQNGTPPREHRQKMTRRRRTIANRLIEAQQNAAMLTTFNEIDMQAVMILRKRRKEAFKEKYGVSLGLSSFFVKATISALKAFPYLNAEIDGNEIILKDHYDIGIAIGSEEGLVVPVLRDADRMSFSQIEGQIRTYAKQVSENKLSLDALMGGTFSITNGGVFGSLLSTPILNYPQVGILGLHGIKERPTVVDGDILAHPLMYVALTYDHRIVDGREAVQFLVHIKALIEDPELLLIEG